MEKNQNSKNQEKGASQPQNPHEMIMKDRNQLKMTGVIEVISATSNLINTKTECGPLTILGHDLRVNLLDIESKIVEIIGEINEIKYIANKKSFFQKVFK